MRMQQEKKKSQREAFTTYTTRWSDLAEDSPEQHSDYSTLHEPANSRSNIHTNCVLPDYPFPRESPLGHFIRFLSWRLAYYLGLG